MLDIVPHKQVLDTVPHQQALGIILTAMSSLFNSCLHDNGVADRTRMRGCCAPHDIRLVARMDLHLQEAGHLDEEREVLVSRAVLCRHSAYFRDLLRTVPIRG